MKVIYHKIFDKHFEKLSSILQNKVIKTVEIFKKNPFDPILQNHSLKGHMNNKHAISVTYVLVIMIDVGTHNQVYHY